jgi:hypothetical protein
VALNNRNLPGRPKRRVVPIGGAGPPAIPERITEDDRLLRRFRVGLSSALATTLNESEWKKLSALHGLETYINDHARFLRACQWDDCGATIWVRNALPRRTAALRASERNEVT